MLRPEVLERTGMRAALAYLRIGVAGDAIDPNDIVEVMRRPTRGLPQWFPDRLSRRSSWSLAALRGLADQVPDKEAAKVLRLADDLRLVVDAARRGTTRDVLEAVRDDVGLGTAMGMLDRTGGAQGSSHLDDLEGLLGVADLHPDPAGFEAWLRRVFSREADPEGVTLSTVHRVKGREWDRVAVFGVVDGVVPHRLSEDCEEERRVLHVAITLRPPPGVLGDRTRRRRSWPSWRAPHPSGRRPARGPMGCGAHRGHGGAVVQEAQGQGRAVGRGRRHRGRAGPGAQGARGLRRARWWTPTGAAPASAWPPAAASRCATANGWSTLVAPRHSLAHRAVGPGGGPRPAAGLANRAGQGRRPSALRRPVRRPACGIALTRPTDAKGLLACDGIGPTKLRALRRRHPRPARPGGRQLTCSPTNVIRSHLLSVQVLSAHGSQR
ncbi:MAG: 3'-5' exonuclease [Acidimicrobiales bacterium]